MKSKHTLFLPVILLAFQTTILAQPTPEALLSQLPGIPTVNCTADRSEIDQFSDQISAVQAAIKEQVERIHATAQTQLNPSKVKMPTNVMANAEKMMALSKEQAELNERIMERMNRVSEIFKAVEDRDTIETRILAKKTEPLEKQLCSGVCTKEEAARSDAAEKKIHELNVQYCQMMSPLHTEAISQYLTTVKSLLPDYRRLSIVQNKFAGLQQMGQLVPETLSGYAAVDEYASALLTAYKYWVGKFNQ